MPFLLAFSPTTPTLPSRVQPAAFTSTFTASHGAVHFHPPRARPCTPSRPLRAMDLQPTSTSLTSHLPDVPEASHLPLSAFDNLADELANAATTPISPAFSPATPPLTALHDLLALPAVAEFLVLVSRSDPFSPAAARPFQPTPSHLALLRAYKQLKSCYNLPVAQLLAALLAILTALRPAHASPLADLAARVSADTALAPRFLKHVVLAKTTPVHLRALYAPNADVLLQHHPHALYPTAPYRASFGHTVATPSGDAIEAVMETSVTASIRIVRDVLSPTSPELRDVYKPLGRCVAVIDSRVDAFYGDQLAAFFDAHQIPLHKLVHRCMQADKSMSNVQAILADLKAVRISRNEPVLIVGGGVMADMGGLACALYHRNTPYVMLCTSVVSAIIAGASPRTCCDGLGYKNLFGAYHPPVLTLTDRSFFRTLRPAWIRHGIADIINMAVTKDATLFDDLELAADRLVDTKFGIEQCDRGAPIDVLSETIIGKAMHGYVEAEYANVWETHQCRPQAYGHTWSPGFELQSGLLHGHAVSIEVGFGAYLSVTEGWLPEADFHRILRVMSAIGLALRQDILNDIDLVWSAQIRMTEQRGGNLCAPVPKNAIGTCGYINDVSRERLEQSLLEYQNIVRKYPREGLGIDCEESPAPVVYSQVAAGNGDANGNGNPIDEYNAWIVANQQDRRTRGSSSALAVSTLAGVAEDSASPPAFEPTTLFHAGAEEYASEMTSPTSADFDTIATETERAGLFAPCMVGRLEGQFLRMVAGLMGAKRVLDVGTFTGFSALAFAEGIGEGGEVVTVEGDAVTAAVARATLREAAAGARVRLLEGNARAVLEQLEQQGELFDIVFLDADKINYGVYYDIGIRLLRDGGVLLADNAMAGLLYDDEDPSRQALHEFAQKVRADRRVEQVMLTVREGVLMARKLPSRLQDY